MRSGLVYKTICWNLAVLFMWTQLALAAPATRDNFFSRKRHDYQATTQRNQELLTRKKVLRPASFAEPRAEDAGRTQTASIDATYGLSHLTDLTEFSLPKTLGRITEVYNPPGVTPEQRKLVIQIQDLHTHPGAQRNLVGVLTYLREHYDLPVVCSEGAGARLETQAFSNFPFPSVRERVADRLLEAGELTGEEFLAMTTDPSLPIEGIEDAATYFPNLFAFHEVMAEHNGSQLLVNQLRVGLDVLKLELWNAELLQLDEDREAYELGHLAPHEYIAKLSALGIAQGVPMKGRYEEVHRLQELLRLEGQIDQVRVQYETSRLLKGLSSSTLGTPMARSAIKPLVVAAAALEQGRVSPHTFYKRLVETAERLEPQWRVAAPAVAVFSDYLTVANRLDITAVYAQLDALYRDIQNQLAPTEEARLVAEHQHRLGIFEGLINLLVSNDQNDHFQRHREHYSVKSFQSFLQPQLEQHGIDDRYIDYNAQFLDDRLPQLEEFYDLVKARDESMVRNTLRVLSEYDARLTALITGGFHTQGISRRLRDAGISYLVIAPNVEGELDYERYHALLGGIDTPLPALLSPIMPGVLRVPLGANIDGLNQQFLADGAQLVSAMQRGGASLAAAGAVMGAIVTATALWKKTLLAFLLVAVDSEGLSEVIAQLETVDWSSLPDPLALAQNPTGTAAVITPGEVMVLDMPGQISQIPVDTPHNFEAVYALGRELADFSPDSIDQLEAVLTNDRTAEVSTALVQPGLLGVDGLVQSTSVSSASSVGLVGQYLLSNLVAPARASRVQINRATIEAFIKDKSIQVTILPATAGDNWRIIMAGRGGRHIGTIEVPTEELRAMRSSPHQVNVVMVLYRLARQAVESTPAPLAASAVAAAAAAAPVPAFAVEPAPPVPASTLAAGVPALVVAPPAMPAVPKLAPADLVSLQRFLNTELVLPLQARGVPLTEELLERFAVFHGMSFNFDAPTDLPEEHRRIVLYMHGALHGSIDVLRTDLASRFGVDAGGHAAGIVPMLRGVLGLYGVEVAPASVGAAVTQTDGAVATFLQNNLVQHLMQRSLTFNTDIASAFAKRFGLDVVIERPEGQPADLRRLRVSTKRGELGSVDVSWIDAPVATLRWLTHTDVNSTAGTIQLRPGPVQKPADILPGLLALLTAPEQTSRILPGEGPVTRAGARMKTRSRRPRGGTTASAVALLGFGMLAEYLLELDGLTALAVEHTPTDAGEAPTLALAGISWMQTRVPRKVESTDADVSTVSFAMAGRQRFQAVTNWRNGISAIVVDGHRHEPGDAQFGQAVYAYISLQAEALLQDKIDEAFVTASGITSWSATGAMTRPDTTPMAVMTLDFLERYLPTHDQLQTWVDHGLRVVVEAEEWQQPRVHELLGPDIVVMTPTDVGKLHVLYPHLTVLDPTLLKLDERPIIDALGPRIMEAWAIGEVLTRDMIPRISIDGLLREQIQQLQEQV